MGTTATHPDGPLTLADLDEFGLYTLYEAAAVLRVHADTVVRHGKRMDPPMQLVPKSYRTSPLRMLGREILRLAGVQEIDRAARTCEPSETERQRAKRAADRGVLKGFRVPGSQYRRVTRVALVAYLRESGLPAGWIDDTEQSGRAGE